MGDYYNISAKGTIYRKERAGKGRDPLSIFPRMHLPPQGIFPLDTLKQHDETLRKNKYQTNRLLMYSTIRCQGHARAFSRPSHFLSEMPWDDVSQNLKKRGNVTSRYHGSKILGLTETAICIVPMEESRYGLLFCS